MIKLFKIWLSRFRVFLILITLPSYFFWFLVYKCIVALFNRYIRALFISTFIISRKDIFYSKLSLILIMVFCANALGSFKFIMGLLLTRNDIAFIENVYKVFSFLGLWFSKTSFLAISFVLFDDWFFKAYFKETLTSGPSKNKKSVHRENAISRGDVYIGTDMRTGKPIFLTNEMRSLHTDLIGTTGSGKTASFIFPVVYQDIRAGKGSMIIDAKGDFQFFKKLYTYHHTYNLENGQVIKFINLGDPSFSNTYNPLFRGNAIELKDRIMGAFEWSNEFYRTRAESTLLTLLQAVCSMDKKITFHDLYLLLTEEVAVEYLRSEVSDVFMKRQLELKILSDFDSLKKDCAGLINNIDLMAHGGVEQIVNTYNPDVDLLEAYLNNEIVHFTLPSQLLGVTAQSFGKMLLMDLRSTSGYIEKMDLPRRFYPVFIDEFAEFSSQEFITWLNKARSSGFAIHLSHQSFGDLQSVSSSFVTQLVDNTNLKVVFRVNHPETIENILKQLGTRKSIKETERLSKTLLTSRESDVSSSREVDEFREDPNLLRVLKRGQALIFGKHPSFFQSLYNADYLPDLPSYLDIELFVRSKRLVKDVDCLNLDSLFKDNGVVSLPEVLASRGISGSFDGDPNSSLQNSDEEVVETDDAVNNEDDDSRKDDDSGGFVLESF